MKKFVILQLILVFALLGTTKLFAQDSVKKVIVKKPVAVKPNPYSKYKTYKPVTPGVYGAPVKKPWTAPAQTGVAAKPDTGKPFVPVKPIVPTDNSLNGQYQYLLTKVYKYQQPLLGAYHKSITDTLILARRALKESQAKMVVQAKTIDSLQAGIKANSKSLTESQEKVDEVSLLGIPLTKASYNLIMWGLVIIFGVIAAIVIAKSGAYTREAKYRTQLYNELEEEYKNYKIKANEKEKRMARELQTERNKLDDLLGNS